MTKIKRLRRNFVIVIGFNILMLLVGVGLSLLLPKYLPKEQYGIYRLLTLYITYGGTIHLGFLDGVYLFFGGKNIFKLDQKDNSKIFSTFVVFQLVVGAVLLVAFNFILGASPNKIVYLLIISDLILMNFIDFYHYISQLNEKFTLYSVMFILTKLVVLSLLIPLTRAGFTNGIVFIGINVLVNVFIIGFYYIRYIKVIKFRFRFFNYVTLKKITKIGFPIFIANLVASGIIGIDRFVVDAFFTDSAFAEYSFAVSLIGMFIIFISAVTRLVFPYLKLMKPDNILEIKYILGVVILILFAFALSGYYPMVIVVNWFLPEYTNSLQIVFILLPLLIFKAELDISITNVYKAKMLRRKYFQVSLASFIMSVIIFAVVLQFSKSLVAIAFASMLSYFLWYIISDLYLHIKLSKGGFDKYILLALILAGYFTIGYLDISDLWKFITYILYTSVITGIYLAIDYKKIKKTIDIVREDLNN